MADDKGQNGNGRAINRLRRRRGVTMVELCVAMLASAIMLVAVVGVVASNQRDYNQTYERVHGQLVQEAYVARRTFEHTVREASVRKCVPAGTLSSSIEVYYYSSLTAPALDSYAEFRLEDGNLIVERGGIVPGTFEHTSGVPSKQPLAHNVTSCYFLQSGPCISMTLLLNDGKLDLPVMVTAMRHNE